MSIQPEGPTGEPSSHLDAHTVAALVNQRLDPTQGAEMLRHLAACARCRSEIYALRGVARSLPARRSPVLRRVIFSAAAAALALLVLHNSATDRAPEANSWVERAAPVAAPSLVALQPGAGATVSRFRLRFAWQGAGERSRYQLTLVDSIGGELWRAETTDTFLVAPATLSLPHTALLFWYVDALGPDARFRTTRAIALRLEP